MRDSEVVASIVAGDPSGLAEAYDRYASVLHAYCCTLLREPADAADVVQDTFVIASSRLAGLRDPERLRAWLFAVARNECLRRLRDKQAMSAFDDAADVTDETADVGGDAERAELRALVRAAIQGLGAVDRDVIVLHLSHGLEAAEIAAVLGVSRNHAHALMSRARAQLQACMGALLVCRAGRRDCPELSEMLASWDGELTMLMRKRVTRHIERCDICSARRNRELQPAMLLGLAAGPALLGAATAARHARQAAPLAEAARRRVLRAATGDSPVARAKQAAVLGRAGSAGRDGFPRPLSPPGYGPWGTSRGQLITAAGIAAAVAAVTLFALLPAGSSPGQFADRASGPKATITPAASPSAGPGSTPGPASPGSGSQPAAAPASPGQPTSASPSASPSAAPLAAWAPTPPAAPAPSGGPSASSPGTPPSSQPPASGPPSSGPPATPPPTTPPPPAPGTISVSPSTIVLTPLLGSSLTITAHGGPVSWSISEPSSLIGKVSVSQSSGMLAAGRSVTVTVTTSLLSLDSHITVSPGGLQVAVVIGLL
jgi:RNA polymerase sigma factor (sigma-70 family)